MLAVFLGTLCRCNCRNILQVIHFDRDYTIIMLNLGKYFFSAITQKTNKYLSTCTNLTLNFGQNEEISATVQGRQFRIVTQMPIDLDIFLFYFLSFYLFLTFNLENDSEF